MEKILYYIQNEQRRNKLPIYSYTVPEFVSYQMNMPIHNEQRELVYLLKKTRHRFLTQIAHMLLRYGMPYCYQVQTQDKIPIYKIECLFTGFRYTLLNCSSYGTNGAA
uniref:tubby C-terminal domain-like protein n=1 Tax=Peribacillus sp. FSL E2-0218 TaxID=2921364 RepID=UPI00403F780A